MFKLKLNQNSIIIIYKLLVDLLFIILFFFALTLLAEGLIPGIVSTHISFSRIIILSFLNIFAIYFVGNFSKINIAPQKTNKKTTIFMAVFGIILVFNSLLKLNLILALTILFLIIISSYLIYKNIID
ncbi:MAG: hypothetical protein US30_C0004G0135 [Candidatus Moranbacteria bacterium GW2011_GWF2_36_839]|nr:MAG: hypothetical protein US27_C0002G0138 [Candidatus Moranbacteria bacterium GW2011_GWF1_36_78]KKQ17391.1 MAG: hypothetical protein US30_C0004G0135 [Candidatus Moranbacteria bacterium GW2011_GWF2_36_839]HAT73767.1 hypothetical protein [Candidatus Moranbacteria bacterium]HBY11090.1 hypothetical protein [Candidatus Moranbacteria bacterium]